MSLRAQIELMTVPQDFTHLCNVVLTAQYGDDFLPIDDDRADRGNDGYVKSEKRMFAAHCFKRVQNQRIDQAVKAKMVGDLGKAIALKQAGIWDIDAWTFLSNYPIAEEIAAAVIAIGKNAGIDVGWRGPEYFEATLQKNPELARVLPGLQLNEISTQLSRLQEAVEELHPESESAPQLRESFGVPHSAEERAELIRVRPPAWEYLLFAGVLSQGKADLEPKWRDHELQLPARRRESLGEEEIVSRLSTAFGRLGSIIEPMTRVFGGQEAAFGAPGEPGDPVRIEHLAQWILRAYEDMLDWAAELRAMGVPEEFEGAVELVARAADRPLSQFREFVEEVVSQSSGIPEHLAKSQEEREREPLIIEPTLVVSLDSDLTDEAIRQLERALSR